MDARPGRWAVGEAGFVEFDLTGDGLVLVAVTEADGWSASVDEESDDEIEWTSGARPRRSSSRWSATTVSSRSS